MNAQLSSIAAAMACAALIACGGSEPHGSSSEPVAEGGAADSGPMTTHPEASPDAGPPPDPGAPSDTYPAFPPDVGQILNNGGLVLKSPVIVAITWNGDPSQGTFDSFADTVGETSYWKATCTEYGVGSAACGAVNHVHLSTAAPAQVTDQDVQNLVLANAGAVATTAGVASDAGTDAEAADAAADGETGPAWPAATSETIYAFFLPPGTSLQTQTNGGSTGDACSAGIGGYHDQVTVGGVTTSYAVVPSCSFPGGNPAAQQTTMSMSHELIEAVTDPHPRDNNPGYVGFDDAHFSFDWFQEFSDEVGDACEFFDSSFYEDQETTPVAFDYWVQRTWSNKSGLAGHDPCVPAPSTPYFNVTPLNLQMVGMVLPAQLSSTGKAQPFQTKGLHVAVGQSATLALGFYSDAPTGGPWTLGYSLGSPVLSQKPTYLTVSLDRTTGQNGDKAYATVKVNSLGKLNGELVVFHSKMNGVTHYMPVVVGSE